MNSLLAGMKCISVLTYLSDIVVYSKTFIEHLPQRETLFKRCEKKTLQLSPTRSTLCELETTYSRCFVSAHEVEPDTTKIEHIIKYPVPKDR